MDKAKRGQVSKEQGTKKKKVKKAKGRIKIVPIVLVVFLIAGFFIFEHFFLNSVVKSFLVSTIESEYGAKCDIENVDLDIFAGSFTIEQFELADKSKPMQNLFEFSRASIDFDVTQVFLGRFIADELALEGFILASQRSVSGEIAIVEKEVIEIDDARSEGVFTKALANTSSELKTNTKNIIEQAIETYNPENILSSYLDQLQVPGLVSTSEQTVEDIASYWIGVVPSLEKTGKDLFSSADEVRALLDTQTVDVQTITSGVQTIQSLISQSQSLQAQLDEVSVRLEKDVDSVENLNKDIQDAIKADAKLVQNEIEKVTSFSVEDAQGLISSTFEKFIIGVLGDYYPIIQKGLAILSNVKTEAEEGKAERTEKNLSRMPGRNVHFNSELPTMLIRKIAFSASTEREGIAVTGDMHDVTNNQNLLKRPTSANFALSYGAFEGVLDSVIDFRTENAEAPVSLDFSGTGLDTSFLQNSSAFGVPTIGGNASMVAQAFVGFDGGFDLQTTISFNPALLSVNTFDPKAVYDIYESVLSRLESFYVQSNIGFSVEKGIEIAIDTDIDSKINNGITQALNDEIETLKANLKQDAEAYIATYSEQFMQKVESFGISRASVQDLQKRLANIDTELVSMRQEMEQRLKDQAKEAVKSTVQDAVESGVKDAASGLLKGLF